MTKMDICYEIFLGRVSNNNKDNTKKENNNKENNNKDDNDKEEYL